MKQSQKYLKNRIDKGVAEGSKSEYFILDAIVKKVMDLYLKEQINKVIILVKRQSSINGSNGLWCSKKSVIELLNKIKKEKFEIPDEFYNK